MRPLQEALTEAKLEDMKSNKYAKNTGKKYNWACKASNQWQEKYLDSNVPVSDDIVLSDLTVPKKLEKRLFCNALCKFISKVRKYQGDDYPPQTVKGLIIAIQMYLKSNWVN